MHVSEISITYRNIQRERYRSSNLIFNKSLLIVRSRLHTMYIIYIYISKNCDSHLAYVMHYVYIQHNLYIW